ncbi:ubiquitin-conjugating enzyme/RWD-like protein [Artemisia annua]|uniref:Ubiquitin-conjugating enzyme/RWD-like protein n=1 Tax=Artemisia annua TaxID=35608 RepID=A0A2U1N7V1_ARTAN|nr:ubiquitin-conjugating enzyme/RWD-like protein [Artemisia annua]
MKDLSVDLKNSPMASLAYLDEQDVLKRYRDFKKFDVVEDYSDHLIGAHMRQASSCVYSFDIITTLEYISVEKIEKEWKILKENLPGTFSIIIRISIIVSLFHEEQRHSTFALFCDRENICEGLQTMRELLRAVIIRAEGTPYHDGLFFFDVCMPGGYVATFSPEPRVRYHSHHSDCLSINPHIYASGEVSFSLLRRDRNGKIDWEEIWIPGTSNMVQLLVCIQDMLLNANPLLNYVYYRSVDSASIDRQQHSLLNNENTIIKTLKTMISTMNKPPKHFEELVIGHFRSRVRHILTSCKGYMEGLFLEGKKEERCSVEFRKDVASYVKPLVDAFIKIGAKEAHKYLLIAWISSIIHPQLCC